VEHVRGFVLVAFSNPLDALHFATRVMADMKAAPWSDALLQQPLAEELVIAVPGVPEPIAVLRGPRVKAGFELGDAKAEVHATTRTIMYRGKVMNRASRIAGIAKSGEVRTAYQHAACGSDG
jgi:class 3 adenylate cyclase